MNPLKTQLHILQLEGYQPARFLRWWLSHPFTFSTSQKKPLVYTFKTKLILVTTFIQVILFVLFLNFPLNLVAVAVFAFEPFPLLLLSLLIIKPYEIVRRFITKTIVRNKILSNPRLTVIGITGSYGKTSTKDFLFEILRRDHKTLRTPESYNTVFGIAKVVDLELHRHLHFFIAEFGAYVRGEIKELTWMVPPKFAILTAIGSQHLERFKTLENTTLAKFELIDAVGPENSLVNLDNQYINKHINQDEYSKVKTYSLSNSAADFFVNRIKFSESGITFSLTHKSKSFPFITSLFGTTNLENLTAAISMAIILGIDISTIQKSVKALAPSPHRLELTRIGDSTLIDNAFSSNEEGFRKVLYDLKQLKGKKALITPGMVELGKQTALIHEKLGSLAGEVFDEIVLVGRSERTENLAKGISGNSKVSYLDNSSSVWPTIDVLARKYDWILLENDLPDNF